MNIKLMINKIKKQFVICSSSEKYISYLRKLGATIGNNTKFLSPRKSFIDENRAAYITIGDNCVICQGVTILAHDYSWSVLMKSHNKIYPSGGGPVQIGNNVFLGVNEIVLRNVSLGDNVIVAAGSVVTRSFGSNLVIGGNPAKVIYTLDEYCEKRRRSFIEEARQNAIFIYKKYERYPKESEMRNFSVLYSSEKEDSKSVLGMDNREYKAVRENNPAMWLSYDNMIQDLLKGVQ